MNDQAKKPRTRTQDTLQVWIYHGVLIPLEDLAQSWERPLAELNKLNRAKQLLVVTHDRKKYCPADFKLLPVQSVQRISALLSPLKPTDQLLFWLRTHGVFAGKTIAQALREGQLDRTLELAEAWVIEHAGVILKKLPE